jgi:transcriptional regulator with XRE-family HTH domain
MKDVIAGKIKRLREEKLKLTQQQLADRLDLERGSVANWEYGKGISRKNAVRLADLAGVPIGWLLSDQNDPLPASASPQATTAEQPAAPQTAPSAGEQAWMRRVIAHLLARQRSNPLSAPQAEKLAEAILSVVRSLPDPPEGEQVEARTQGIIDALSALLPPNSNQ